MRIKKFGHACLLVEEGSAKILIDPGNYSTIPALSNIDAILITHEHPDHLSLDSLRTILANNPEVKVFTNNGVAKILEEAGIGYLLLGGGESAQIQGVSVQGYGIDHALIYESIPRIRNTGYMIANKFFHPGDSLTSYPPKVQILALPVSGPWMKISETLDYALKIKPQVCFPVHDGMLRPDRMGPTRIVPPKVLGPSGIEFRDMVEGSVEEF